MKLFTVTQGMISEGIDPNDDLLGEKKVICVYDQRHLVEGRLFRGDFEHNIPASFLEGLRPQEDQLDRRLLVLFEYRGDWIDLGYARTLPDSRRAIAGPMCNGAARLCFETERGEFIRTNRMKALVILSPGAKVTMQFNRCSIYAGKDGPHPRLMQPLHRRSHTISFIDGWLGLEDRRIR